VNKALRLWLRRLVLAVFSSSMMLVVGFAIALPSFPGIGTVGAVTGDQGKADRDSFVERYSIGPIEPKDVNAGGSEQSASVLPGQNLVAKEGNQANNVPVIAGVNPVAAAPLPARSSNGGDMVQSQSQVSSEAPPYKSLYDRSIRHKLIESSPASSKPDASGVSRSERPSIYR